MIGYIKNLKVVVILSSFLILTACSKQDTVTVNIESPAKIELAKAVYFDGAKTKASSGEDIISYSWVLSQDGKVIERKKAERVKGEEKTDSRFYYTFEENADYEITLTAKDAKGTVGNKSVAVKVGTPPQIAKPAKIEIGKTSTFRLSNVSGADKGYYWELTKDGKEVEGGTSTKEAFDFKFKEGGDYKLTVSVNSGAGASKKTIEFSIGDLTVIITQPSVIKLDSLATFDSSGSIVMGNIVSYKWVLEKEGDVVAYAQTEKNEKSLVHPKTFSHMFTQNGRYNLTLWITDDKGSISSKTSWLDVGDLTVSIIKPRAVKVKETTIFRSTAVVSENTEVKEYFWTLERKVASNTGGSSVWINEFKRQLNKKDAGGDFGANDKNQDVQVDSENLAYRFVEAGDYRIGLKVLDKKGNVAYSSKEFKVSNLYAIITNHAWLTEKSKRCDLDTGKNPSALTDPTDIPLIKNLMVSAGKHVFCANHSVGDDITDRTWSLYRNGSLVSIGANALEPAAVPAGTTPPATPALQPSDEGFVYNFEKAGDYQLKLTVVNSDGVRDSQIVKIEVGEIYADIIRIKDDNSAAVEKLDGYYKLGDIAAFDGSKSYIISKIGAEKEAVENFEWTLSKDGVKFDLEKTTAYNDVADHITKNPDGEYKHRSVFRYKFTEGGRYDLTLKVKKGTYVATKQVSFVVGDYDLDIKVPEAKTLIYDKDLAFTSNIKQLNNAAAPVGYKWILEQKVRPINWETETQEILNRYLEVPLTTSSNNDLTHKFIEGGVYRLSLEVTNANNEMSSIRFKPFKVSQVDGEILVPEINESIVEGKLKEGLQVDRDHKFNLNSKSKLDIVETKWVLKLDGAVITDLLGTLTDDKALYRFVKTGNYELSAKITDENGVEGEVTPVKFSVVKMGAAITKTADFVKVGEEVEFKSNNSPNTDTSVTYEWSLYKANNPTAFEKDYIREVIKNGTQVAEESKAIAGKKGSFSANNLAPKETSVLENFKHTFTKPGYYRLVVKITDAHNTYVTKDLEFAVSEIEPEMKLPYTYLITGKDITFKADHGIKSHDGNYLFRWTLKDKDGKVITTYDGLKDDGTDFKHKFEKAGKYNLSLTVIDRVGGKTTISKDINISYIEAKISTESKHKSSEDTNVKSEFSSANSKVDTGKNITARSWSLQSLNEDGTLKNNIPLPANSANGETFSHNFTTSGLHKVILTISDDSNLTGTDEMIINVEDGIAPKFSNFDITKGKLDKNEVVSINKQIQLHYNEELSSKSLATGNIVLVQKGSSEKVELSTKIVADASDKNNDILIKVKGAVDSTKDYELKLNNITDVSGNANSEEQVFNFKGDNFYLAGVNYKPYGIYAADTLKNIVLTFSKPVDSASATVSNFKLGGGLKHKTGSSVSVSGNQATIGVEIPSSSSTYSKVYVTPEENDIKVNKTDEKLKRTKVEFAYIDLSDNKTQVFYLKADASGSGTGANWTNAFTTIKDAVAAINGVDPSNYDRVVLFVDEGEYKSDVATALQLTKDDTFIFGVKSDASSSTMTSDLFNSRTADPAKHIISGVDSSDPEKTAETILDITADKFHIEGIGFANGGNKDLNAKIVTLSGTNERVFESCLFKDNKGTALYDSKEAYSPIVVRNSKFINNSNTALVLNGYSSKIVNSSFVENKSATGAGAISLTNSYGDLKVVNSTFYKNLGSPMSGSAINTTNFSSSYRSTISNSNFVLNGIVVKQPVIKSSYVKVYNSVLWQNSSDLEDESGIDLQNSVVNKNDYLNLSMDSSKNIIFVGMSEDSPLGEWDATKYIFKPKAGSVTINAGNNDLYPYKDEYTQDPEGNVRIKAGTIDIGVSEYSDN